MQVNRHAGGTCLRACCQQRIIECIDFKETGIRYQTQMSLCTKQTTQAGVRNVLLLVPAYFCSYSCSCSCSSSCSCSLFLSSTVLRSHAIYDKYLFIFAPQIVVVHPMRKQITVVANDPVLVVCERWSHTNAHEDVVCANQFDLFYWSSFVPRQLVHGVHTVLPFIVRRRRSLCFSLFTFCEWYLSFANTGMRF